MSRSTHRSAPELRLPELRDLQSLRPDPSAPREDDGAVRVRAVRRLTLAGAGLGLGLLALSGRASSIMLLPDPQLENKARVQFEDAIELEGRRGDLLDRNYTLLATTVELGELHLDPSLLAQLGQLNANRRATLIQGLAALLEMQPAQIDERVANPSRRDVLLGRGLSPAESARVRELVHTAAGKETELRAMAWVEEESRRYYPGRSDAAALVGVVGHNGHGMAGLERSLDRVLQGETYKYMQWRDRKGRKISPEQIHVPAGTSVVLTLDRRIQHAAELALDETMVRTGAVAAYAVVVDVLTGELLALANRPTQNVNDLAGLRLEEVKNHAAMDAIEPGSVFKPFVAAAAVEEKLVTGATIVDCEGGNWLVGRKVIHDDHPHGAISVAEVIKYSSNIGTAKLAFRLGPEKTLQYLKDFGFGRKTGLELPGESRGVLRSASEIKPIELATTAYGHGATATAVQLAHAMAVLGNNGLRMKPMLVREYRNEHGETLRRFEPEAETQVISSETARATIDMMSTVVEEGGTGTRARIPGYAVAGKTGTAWKHIDGGGYSETERIGSFVGLVPANAPRVAIVVVVDGPTIGSKYGGVVAAPAFSSIGSAAMRILGVPPDPALQGPPRLDAAAEGLVTEVAPPPAPVFVDIPTAAPELQWNPDGSLKLPSLQGLTMRDALVTLQGAGLQVRARGSGRVFGQSPTPGSPLLPGQVVELVLQ